MSIRGLAIAVAMAGTPTLSAALELTVPASTVTTGEWSKPDAGFVLPVAPFSDGKVASLQLSGTPRARSMRFPLNGLTTADVMATLRAQVTSEGYTPLLDCSARACGGFDFRYELTLLPEPDMHVDLGDFRFLSAVKSNSDGDPEHVQLVVSRSPANAYVQITTISKEDRASEIVAATKTPDAKSLPDPLGSAELAEKLLDQGHAVLDGLEFQTGSSDLEPGSETILEELAVFLKANPDLTVALVGHTDAEGSLAGNLALSRKRAETVMNVLKGDFAIPSESLEAQGVGYLSPIAPNTTDAGRQKNRRVEVVITSTR